MAPAKLLTTRLRISHCGRWLQAKIKLAKARATATGAEMDLKMLNGRIREIMK